MVSYIAMELNYVQNTIYITILNELFRLMKVFRYSLVFYRANDRKQDESKFIIQNNESCYFLMFFSPAVPFFVCRIT